MMLTIRVHRYWWVIGIVLIMMLTSGGDGK